MESPVFFHIDVNSAYLSWTAVKRLREFPDEPDLRTIPAVVGGDESKRHGVVLAKSIPAKKYGIHTGESLMSARQKCGHLTVVPPEHKYYNTCSRAFVKILEEYSPEILQYSIDEVFMDMTGLELLLGDMVTVAHTIRKRIKTELGFTVNIGISCNKLLAKMASDFEKPDKVHTLFPEEIEKKMWPLPVRELFFVGRSAEKKLATMGIYTIGDLARSDVEVLKHHLKSQGEVIYEYANGREEIAPLAAPSASREYGNSITLTRNVEDKETAHLVLLSLCESVGARLRADHVKISCVSVVFLDSEFRQYSHQMQVPATDVTDLIYQHACQVFDQGWKKEPLRLIGVQTTKVQEEAFFQYQLFGQRQTEKQSRLDRAIDAIRDRYGEEAVMRASFLKKKEDDQGK